MAHRDLPLTQVAVDPGQPRKDLGDLDELATRIWLHGLLHAVVVTEQNPTAFLLLAGERRLTCFRRNRERAEAILAAPDDHSPADVERASAYSSWTVIPAHVWSGDPPPFLRKILQIEENDTNKPLNLLERADAYVAAATESGLTVKDFCVAAGIGRSVFYAYKNCSQTKGLLRQSLLDGTIVDASVVPAFRQLPDDVQTALVEEARREGTPVTRNLVQYSLAGVQKARAAAEATTHFKPDPNPKEDSQAHQSTVLHPPSDHPALQVEAVEWLLEVLATAEPDEYGYRAHTLEVFTAALDRSSPLLLLREGWGVRNAGSPHLTATN